MRGRRSGQRLPELWWRLRAKANPTFEELERRKFPRQAPGKQQGEAQARRSCSSRTVCGSNQDDSAGKPIAQSGPCGHRPTPAHPGRPAARAPPQVRERSGPLVGSHHSVGCVEFVAGVRLTALLCATLLASEGCSALFVQGAPRPGTVEAPECTSSVAAPVADSLVALGAGALGLAALGATIECHRQGDCAENLGPGLLGLSALVFAGTMTSAVYGFHQTGRCRQATTSWCSSHDCGPFAAEPSAPRR